MGGRRGGRLCGLLRPGGCVPLAIVLAAAVAAAAVATAADDDSGEPRIVAIDVARTADRVVCRLRTRGLPGERLEQSMRSGLVSALDFDVSLLDEQAHTVQRGRLTLQLAFDLWEEVFSARDGEHERQFADLQALRAYLSDLAQVPVAPLDRLAGGERYRVEVGLRLHPIAPSQRERLADTIAGDRRPQRNEDAQELSVSLGRLIRLFYDEDEPAVRGESFSRWFTREELDRAAH
jgi:hypothetical protein